MYWYCVADKNKYRLLTQDTNSMAINAPSHWYYLQQQNAIAVF
jgi:hypothetical protein